MKAALNIAIIVVSSSWAGMGAAQSASSSAVAAEPAPQPSTSPDPAPQPTLEAAPASEPASELPPPSELPPDDRAGRKMDLRVAESPAPTQRKAYVHEGFYLRAGVGPGFLYSSISDRVEDETGDTGAFAIAADLMVGGSPAPGLAMGVGALAHVGMGGRVDGESTGALFHLNVGPFFDAFPNDKGAFHLGVLVGGTMVALGSSISPQSPLWGGGGAAMLGWDIWVAPEWSVGAQLQSGGSYATGKDAGTGIFHANLMITILEH
jgi:hypothetical protein